MGGDPDHTPENSRGVPNNSGLGRQYSQAINASGRHMGPAAALVAQIIVLTIFVTGCSGVGTDKAGGPEA